MSFIVIMLLRWLRFVESEQGAGDAWDDLMMYWQLWICRNHRYACPMQVDRYNQLERYPDCWWEF